MRRLFRTGLAGLLAGVLIAGLARPWNTGAEQDKHGVARMTEKMKTVCVGRFLVDLPADAQYEFHRPRVDGFDINVFDESADDFEQRVLARRRQLEAVPDGPGGRRNLESRTEVSNEYGVNGHVFVHARSVTEGQSSDGLTIQRYRYESVSVEALVHANGLSIDLSAPGYHPESIARLAKLIAQLVPNPESRIPTEPGFCIDRAVILDPLSADQGEEIMMAAWLPHRPDILFKIMLAAGTEPDRQGLLERGSESDTRLSDDERTRVSRIRADKRRIGGIDGEELVERFVENNDAVVYSYWWEVNGTVDNVFIPHIVVKMDTGHSQHGPVPSSLSENAATCLWETMLTSFRVRPSDAAAARDTAASPMPIGTQALAGDKCPESGWWECTDGGEDVGVLGGRRQYIKQGERIPQALLLSRPSLWERLRGLQASFASTVPTSWKLVDKRARKRVTHPVPLAKPIVGAGTGTPSLADFRQVHGQHVSIGSFVTTGFPCPASGWWRCEDTHALDGTRWFAQGSLLPPATFALPPSLFGHSENAPKSIQRRAAWRLVRFAQAPEHASEHGAPDAADAKRHA